MIVIVGIFVIAALLRRAPVPGGRGAGVRLQVGAGRAESQALRQRELRLANAFPFLAVCKRASPARRPRGGYGFRQGTPPPRPATNKKTAPARRPPPPRGAAPR